MQMNGVGERHEPFGLCDYEPGTSRAELQVGSIFVVACESQLIPRSGAGRVGA